MMNERGENKLNDEKINEFYILYKKAKENLERNISGFHDDIEKESFIENFLMQLLISWFLQEKGFFNDDVEFFINQFKNYKKLTLNSNLKDQLGAEIDEDGHFVSYYDFLKALFSIMMGESTNGIYNDETCLGKIVVTGTAPFINGSDLFLKNIRIKDKVFYIESETDHLQKTEPQKVNEVPILNLFESRDWTEGNIDEYVLGALYEKIITQYERKTSGTYYTPEEVTKYIANNAIRQFVLSRVNLNLNKDFKSLDLVFSEADEDIIQEVFNLLRNIKIIDPAVGSAHFLESSIETLITLYEQLKNTCEKLGLKKGLSITMLDVNGKLKKQNLLGIKDKEKFKLYLKFYIILMRNIYGVDINANALKVARARLFLSIAKHFNKDTNCFIKFPNVHFNLRNGNSLIGFVGLDQVKEEEVAPGLLNFLNTSERTKMNTTCSEIIKINDYFQENGKILNVDILSNVDKLNKILQKKDLSKSDVIKILKIKMSLMKLLIVSLNLKSAIPLNEILNQISLVFKQKLNDIYSTYSEVDLEDLKTTNTFHWFFEFPEVFLTKSHSGFDVIVGNPPFVRADTEDVKNIKQREILANNIDYDTLWEKWDIFVAFFERSLAGLLCKEGIFSFIVSDGICYAKYAKKLRKFIQEHYIIANIDYFEGFKIFKGIGVTPIIISIVKKKPVNIIVNKRIHSDKFLNISETYQEEQEKKTIWRKEDTWILDINFPNTEPLGNICYISKGIVANSDEKLAKGEFTKRDIVSLKKPTDDCWKFFIEGKDLDAYKYKRIRYIEWGTERSPKNLSRATFPDLYLGSKIIRGKTNDGVVDNYELITDSTTFVFKRFCDLKKVSNSSINNSISRHNNKLEKGDLEKISEEFNYFYLNALLNSKLIHKYLDSVKTQKINNMYYPNDYRKLPIPRYSSPVIIRISKILHYINYISEDLFKKFSEIIDFLVIELYFHRYFFKEGFYKKNERILDNLLEKFISSIDDYDLSESLLDVILDNISFKEDNYLLGLAQEIEKKTERILIEIENDSEIQKLIQKLRLHKWARLILS